MSTLQTTKGGFVFHPKRNLDYLLGPIGENFERVRPKLLLWPPEALVNPETFKNVYLSSSHFSEFLSQVSQRQTG